MKKTDQNTTLKELQAQVLKFRDDRNWAKHHTPKNLSISIAIEAAELLENFQWDKYSVADKNSAKDELADILVYAMYLADALSMDIASGVDKKLAKSDKKYPKELFSNKTDNAEDYWVIKQKYRGSQGKK
jgi:NTP pyrophosphatase (non-canonical NTP hydrolase)